MPTHQDVQTPKRTDSARKHKPANKTQSPLMELINTSAIIQFVRLDPASLKPGDVLQLQRTIGNQGVGRLLSKIGKGTTPIQLELTINPPGDKYEQEADRIAEQVVSMSAPASSQPSCQGKREEKGDVQTKPLSASITPVIQPKADSSIEVGSELESCLISSKGGGSPMPEHVRTYFEPRFGVDFSQVRFHTDSRAAETAQAINARAFTLGKDIVFGAGQYAPETSDGKRLLAHELMHVVQQGKRNDIVQCWNIGGHRKITNDALERDNRFSASAKLILIQTVPTQDYNRPQILQDMISFWAGQSLYRAPLGFIGGAVVGGFTPPGQGYQFSGVVVSGVLPQAILGAAGVRVPQELPNHGEGNRNSNISRMNQQVETAANQTNSCETERGLIKLGYALHTAQDRASHGEGYSEGLAARDVPHHMIDTIATNPDGYIKAIDNSREAINSFIEKLTNAKLTELSTFFVPPSWNPPVIEMVLPPLPPAVTPLPLGSSIEPSPGAIPIIRIMF